MNTKLYKKLYLPNILMLFFIYFNKIKYFLHKTVLFRHLDNLLNSFKNKKRELHFTESSRFLLQIKHQS